MQTKSHVTDSNHPKICLLFDVANCLSNPADIQLDRETNKTRQTHGQCNEYIGTHTVPILTRKPSWRTDAKAY